ncbi:MAG: InlB B-repeat-containing protein, partial [Butyrivibrio sp.]|nr:InlB B-repeat-containing protein [Butyrivibrio sp.]
EEDPVITSYSISGEDIAFSAKDTQSGLSAYAISTASSASGVSGWTSVTGAPIKDDEGISGTATFDTLEPGNYYLYAKDASGNVARSDDYISISVLNVHNYYVNNAATQYSVHVATPEGEDATANLPSATPTRTKFDFGGFYPSEEFNGESANAGAAVSINAGEENDYYAKWTLKGVVFANDLSATYSKTYDGEDLELSVSLTESYDTVSWTWYRAAAADGNYAAVTGGADGTLALKNVSDSGFYKAVASITEEGVSSIADSSVAQVTISKRPLYINVDNKETVYGSDAPSFTMTAAEPDGTSGLVSGDSLESVFGAGYASNLSCDYVNDGGANSVVGTYNITAGSLSADNYDVTFTSGTLTVTTLSVDSNVTVEVSVEDGPFTYTGSAIEPAVTAVDITYTPAGAGASVTKTLSAEDYDVSYANNVNVGSQAQVIITFKGNYQGQYSGKTFEIGKGTMAVQTSISYDSWKYGETPAGISVSIDNTTGGTVSYKYLPVGEEESFAAADKSGAVTTMPKDAGRYYVWAEIAETANYSAITAEPAIFEIRKRQITLTSTSKSWTYDGNPHTAGNYVQTGDAFIEGEGFHSVMVSGSVKTVSESPVVNDITYTLTSSTKAVNYEITLEKGSLSVTQARLPKITSLKWGTTPGTLQWVAITRDGLNIQYEVQLYRGEETLGEPIITSNTSVDAKELLINDSIANGVGAYTATVTAKIGEDAAGMYNNYMEGTASEKLPYKYTAKITLVRNGGDEGIESLAFADAVHGADEDDTVTYLLQKESARAVITYNSGYENDDAGTVFNYNTGSTGLSRGDYTKSGYYTVSFANTQLDSAVDANLAIKSKDSAPYCEEFTGSQASDYSYVRADIRIGDLLGLYGYKLVNSIDNITDDNWTEISFVEGRPALSCITSVQLTAAGSYYLVFKDISGNIRYCETPITVYEISFDKNDDAATGTMPGIYKLKDNAVTLPANAFTKAGYVFTYWTAGSAILPDGASYVKNESATLKAGWTNKKFTYKVNYYYQKILLNNDGTVMTDDGGQVMLSYGDEPENYAVYSCAYNDEVSYNAAAIQLEREGYRLTSLPSLPEGSASYVSSIRVTEDGMELDIYYNLEMYTMTYSYTDYDNTSKTMVDYFYYGQPFVERTKPAHTGYSFIGWNYGDAGRAPEFMPAGSLTATGHFKADTASYTIRYYFQNIDTENGAGNYLGTSFVMDGSIQADEVISADYGRQINAYLSSDETSTSKEIVTAREIPGFTPVAVVVSYESSEAKSFASLAELNAFAETTSNDSDLTHNVYSKIEGGAPEGVQDGPTYVSFYYTRKVYELSMDVYRGNRDDGQHLFGSYFDEDQAKWNFPYGYAFPATGTFSAEYFETYKYNDEGTITYDNGREHSVAWTKRWPTGAGIVPADKYYLANFVDWSTGSRPVTMPAGDVKVVREYASREQSKYVIEVYVEHVKEVNHTYGGNTYKSYDAGFYEKETSFESYVEPGRIVSIVDSGEGSEVEIPISKLIEGVDSKAHFEHVPVDGEVLSAVVLENRYTEDNTSILPDSVTTLKLYMSRKKYDVNIRYLKRVYDVDAGTSSDEVITSYKINQKWGTSYNIDSEYYYQGETESVPVGDNEDNAKAKAYLGTVTDSAAVTGTMDFAAADYKIANYWYYVSPSSNSILGYAGGHADYTAYEDAAGAEADRFKAIRVGVNNSSKAEIYYLQPASSKHYYLKLTYRQYVNGVQTTDSAPLTSEVDGVTYQICVANKSDVFESSDPGAALRPEFEEVNVTYYKTATELGQSQSNPGISGTFYRLIDDPHSQKLLFTVVDDDRFHVGGLAGYNYNSTVAAHIGRETFEAEENAPDPNLGTPVLVARGDERIGARGSENPILGVNNDTEDYCYNQMSYYFNFNKDFSITYVYDGKTRRIDYGQITDVTADEIGFDRDGANVFEPGEGYEIVWYTDSNFTHVADATIKVNGPKYIYGKRFNKPIENFDIAYYEMPNGAGYYSGSLDSASLTSETEDIEIEYRFDENTAVNKAGTNTKYYLNGTLVAVKKSHFVKAFSEFSMDYASFVTSGFKHDEKNTSNVLSGFCGSRPIKLRSYYARTSALLTIRRNDSDTVSNDEIITKVNGDLVRVYDPVKIGYDFTGWKFYDYTGSVKGSELNPADYNYVYNPVDQHHQGYSEFDMPICDTLMEAQWTPAVIEFDIVHLFQDRAKAYRQDLLDSCIAGSAPANVVTDVVSGVTYYYENSVSPNNLFGAVEELSGVRSEDVIAVSDHNLSAAGSMVSFAHGTYQHNAADSGELVSGDTFRAYHNASVTFFYERNSTITISTGAYCMDGSDDTGLTVSGAGNYYYGQQVNLYATMQPTGYTFQGWFKVNSGEALTTEQIESLADLLAAEGTDGAVLTKVYNDTEYSFTATESGRYIAITAAAEAIQPTITITISRDLVNDPLYYNYKADAENQFNASINWGQGVDAGANNIKQYTWFYYSPDNMTAEQFEELDPETIPIADMTPLENSNTSTFNLPTGYNAGFYVLRCVADIERKDNGRTQRAQGSYKFSVLPNNEYLETTPVVDQSYTGNTYRYTEKWLYRPTDYTVYYSESPFTLGEDPTARLALSEGDADKAYTQMPGYRDVIVDASHSPVPHVVYYYVVSNDPNYSSVTGNCSVGLLPVPVTVTAIKPFTKIYDATVEIQGKPSVGNEGSVTYKYSEADGTYSDFYRLQSGIESAGMTPSPYYRINGILSADAGKAMLLNFDATFDYMHAGGSGVQEGTLVTLSNLWVLTSNDSTALHDVYENWNYVFPTGETLQISGQIKPYPLDIKWLPSSESDASATYSDQDFVYNYTGSTISPYIKIVGDTEKIPDAAGDFSVSVKNKQVNAGTYSAIPEVEAKAGAGYFPTDYTFTLHNQTYKILPRYIKVYPKDVTKVYNATLQTMLDTEDEFRFETKESAGDTYRAYTLPEGEHYNAKTSASYKNAGVYSTIAAKNMAVYTLDANNKKHVITDNYVIEYGTGTLTIERCPVVINGITGVNKEYDGTTLADLDITAATIRLSSDGVSPVYAGDVLTLEKLGKPGDFDTKFVGISKTVTINYAVENADTRGVGIKATGAYANYVIDTANSQLTTTADIVKDGKVNVHITGGDSTITYGESLHTTHFSYEVVGLVEGDSVSADLTVDEDNYPQFMIMKKVGGSYVNAVVTDHAFKQTDDLSFISTLDVGTYYVFFVEKTGPENDGHHFVEGFDSPKYNVCWDYENPATITVIPRKIAVSGIDSASPITKVYDGNTSVAGTDLNTILGAADSHDYYEFTAVPGESASGVMTADASSLVISSADAVYNNKNVAVTEGGVTVGATKVNLTECVLGGSAVSNYELVNSTFDVPGAITPRDITVKINNQTVTYGSAPAAYNYTVEGAVEADEETIIAGLKNTTLTVVDCDYQAVANPTSGKSHDAGYYAMNVNGTTHYTNPNYTITFPVANGLVGETFGLLTVNKKNLRYRAKDVHISYGVQNPPTIFDGEFVSADFVYGDTASTQKNENEKAKIISGTSGTDIALYTDSALTSLAGTYEVEFESTANASSLPGTYPVSPVNVATADGYLYTKNYNITKVSGNLIIKKYYILVEGITVADKVYDGTTTVTKDGEGNQIDLTTATFKYYVGATSHVETYAQLPENFKASFDTADFTAVYADKNVGTNINVSLGIVIKDGSDLAKRYMLLTAANKAEATLYDSENIFGSDVSQTSALSSITAKELVLKPGNISCNYAQSVAASSIVVEGTGFVSGESLANIPGYVKKYTLTSESDPTVNYVAGSDVGRYVIDISSSEPGAGIHGNYNISFDTGILTVNQRTFPAPTNITWNAGRLSWNAVTAIGHVAVAGYKLQLYKVGAGNAVTTIDCNPTTDYDFTEVIRNAGAGTYYVRIWAVASTENNTSPDYKNVKQYGDWTNSANKMAVLVVPKYSDDAVTAKATDALANKNVYPVTGSLLDYPDGYVVVAGEAAGVNVLYSWKSVGTDGGEYATGYEIDSFSASSDTGVTLVTTNDLSASGSFAGSALIADGIEVTSVDLILKLKKRAAQGSLTISGTSDTAPYGALVHTPYEANVSHTDNVGYTYTYEWSYKLGHLDYSSSSTPVPYDVVRVLNNGVVETQNNPIIWDQQTFTFPRGKRAQTYNVLCKVVAKRKDNGETVTLNANKAFTITKPTAGDPDSLVLEVSDWNYGESRIPAECTPLFGDEMGTITIEYRKKGQGSSAWSTAVPTEAGTYEARARSAGTESYPAVTSHTKEFNIYKVTLLAPENFAMHEDGSGMAYGLLKWDAVTGFSENAGVSPASVVSVTYEVKTYYQAVSGTTYGQESLVKTDVVSATQLNVLDYIDRDGRYVFKIRALANERTNAGNNNCNDSETVVLGTPIFGASITTDAQGNSKEYDGEPVTITAGYEDGSDSYVFTWYRNGEVITGADERSYSFVEVNDSGLYSVAVTTPKLPDPVFSVTINVSVTKRPVKITGFDDEKTYDNTALTHAGTYSGAALTAQMYDIVYTGNVDPERRALVDGAALTELTFAGTIRDAGSENNTPSGAKIVNAAGDKTSNYAITYTPGTLTVNKKAANITAPNDTKVYDGTALTAPGFGAGIADNKKITTTGLLTDHEVSAVLMTAESTITEAGSTSNVVDLSSVTIVDTAEGNRDVTANYDLSKTDGILTVTKASSYIDATGGEYTYDGTAKGITASMRATNTEEVFGNAALRYALVTTDENGGEVVGNSSLALTFIHAGVYKIRVSLAESDNHQ